MLDNFLLLVSTQITAVNADNLIDLLVRGLLNLIIMHIVIFRIYYSVNKRKVYAFTYSIFAATVFLMGFILSNVNLQLGFALGLFAIFGIIRYRTDAIPAKEMTYLFLVICLSVINSLKNKSIGWLEISMLNIVLVGICWYLEKKWIYKKDARKTIIYDKLELVNENNKELLRKDLMQLTGLNITKLDIGKVDYVKSSATIVIYYKETSSSFIDDEYVTKDK